MICPRKPDSFGFQGFRNGHVRDFAVKKIKSQEEASKIIGEVEALVRKGHKLTDEQKYEYEFAKIFLTQIGKRRRKQTAA